MAGARGSGGAGAVVMTAGRMARAVIVCNLQYSGEEHFIWRGLWAVGCAVRAGASASARRAWPAALRAGADRSVC